MSETIADICAEMRGKACAVPVQYEALGVLYRQWADRIEAAHKREMAKNDAVRTSELERHCKMCQTERTGEGYGDVPPKCGYDDRCDACEVAKELRFRLGITQAKEGGR